MIAVSNKNRAAPGGREQKTINYNVRGDDRRRYTRAIID